MYLFILDEDGRRITSLATGVHGDTVEELQARAAKDYPTAKTLIGGDEEQAAFMSGKAWDGKAFYTPAPPPVDIEAVRRATLERVRLMTDERINAGFVSGGVRYDSDRDTQLTMQGICDCVDMPRFKTEWPNGAPVRGYDKGATEKTIHWLDAEAIKTFCADLSSYIGGCRRIGWDLQEEARNATTVEELERIRWPEDEG